MHTHRCLNFQEDLYPETQADIPAITADEWWTQRKNADPVLMSMADGGGSNTQGGAEELVVKKVWETKMHKKRFYLKFIPRPSQMF